MYRNFRVHGVRTPDGGNRLPPPPTTPDSNLGSPPELRLLPGSSPSKLRKRVRSSTTTAVKRLREVEGEKGEGGGVIGREVRLWVEYEVGMVSKGWDEEGENRGKWVVRVGLEEGEKGWELILETYTRDTSDTRSKLTCTGGPQLGPSFTTFPRQTFPLPFDEEGSTQSSQVGPSDSKGVVQYTPKLLNFEVISDSLEEPRPAVIIGWYYQLQDSIRRLKRVKYLQFSPHLLTPSLTWSLTRFSTISISPNQLIDTSPLSTLLIDGPTVYLASSHSSSYPDCQLLRWDISNQSLQMRIMESSLPPLGWLNFNHTDYLIHPHFLTRRDAQLLATATTELFPTDSTLPLEPYLSQPGGRGWWREFELEVPLAHQVASLVVEWFPQSNKALPFRVQGWVGLTEGLIKPFGMVTPPPVSPIPLDTPPHSLTWSKAKSHLIAVTQSNCHVIPLNPSTTPATRLDFPNVSFAPHYSNNEVGIYTMDFEGSRCHPILLPSSQKDHPSQHPILARVQNRLMDRCQEESFQLSGKRTLLERKLKLIHDGLELLRNLGHELTTRPELPLASYPPLAPLLPTPRTLRSYYPLPSMIDEEVEVDPALKLPSLPLAQRLRSEFDGDFSAPGLVLGQYWIRVRVINLHCQPLYNLRLQASLSPHLHGTPGLIETLRYWNPGVGEELPPNGSTHLVIAIRVIRVPSGHTLDQIWSLLRLATSWDERVESQLRSATHRVTLPPCPTSTLRIDHLPLPTIVLAIPSLYYATLPSFFAHPEFTSPDPATPHLVTSPTAGLAILISPPPPDGGPTSLHIKGLHPGLLYHFLITLTTRYHHHPSSSGPSPPPLQFLPPTHPTTLLYRTHPNPTGESTLGLSQSLLTYLMAHLSNP